MKVKDQVYNLIILDESGSMNSIKEFIISGFNELVQTVQGVAEDFPEQEHFISFVSFNGRKITTHLDCEPTEKLTEINGENYNPNSGTPLFDAMGESIHHLKEKTKDNKHCNVLVTILTDGMENASKEYKKTAIKALVEELENKKWTFTYIGTDHDVAGFAESISIKNTMAYTKSRDGVAGIFAEERIARRAFSKKIREKKDTKEDYYSTDKD